MNSQVRNVWIPIIVVVLIFMWFLYPSDKRGCKESYGYKGCSRPFDPMRLYNASDPWSKNSTFVVHPEEAAWYYSTVEFPAYLCNQSQRYCYN